MQTIPKGLVLSDPGISIARVVPAEIEKRGQERAWAAGELLRKYGMKVLMGGSPVAPVQHPLGPPTFTGSTITVDTMLNQPTRITRMIMDMTLMRYIADRIFTSAGGVTGGAVVYDEATTNELWLARDVQRVSPGAEFPIVTSERLVPKIAEVEKWGGKTYITDEARQRNNAAMFTNHLRQLGNTIVRKLNARAIDVLEESITASGQTSTGLDWTAVIVGGATQSPADEFPAYDFAQAWLAAEELELGITYDLWIINPQEYAQLIVIYGAAGLRELLSAMNISIYVSPRVTPGTAYVVAQGQVGEMRVEEPLGTETWREQATQRTWVQSSVRPVMYVTNPYAVLKVTGLQG